MKRLIFSLVLTYFFFAGSLTTSMAESALSANKVENIQNNCFEDDIPLKNKSAQVKVNPSSGSSQGGCIDDSYYIEISGASFGSGWDISSVTVCGIEVCHIIMQSSDIVVVYPNSGTPGTGDIVITSKSMGKTTIKNAFTYQVPVPNNQAKNIQYSNVGDTSGEISWERGSAESCVVFMKQADSGLAEPSDDLEYLASSYFGKGTQIEETGWYCVYNGSGTSVTVSGLSPDAAYAIQVFEYNGQKGFETYLISPSFDNPKIQETASSIRTDLKSFNNPATVNLGIQNQVEER